MNIIQWIHFYPHYGWIWLVYSPCFMDFSTILHLRNSYFPALLRSAACSSTSWRKERHFAWRRWRQRFAGAVSNLFCNSWTYIHLSFQTLTFPDSQAPNRIYQTQKNWAYAWKLLTSKSSKIQQRGLCRPGIPQKTQEPPKSWSIQWHVSLRSRLQVLHWQISVPPHQLNRIRKAVLKKDWRRLKGNWPHYTYYIDWLHWLHHLGTCDSCNFSGGGLWISKHL